MHAGHKTASCDAVPQSACNLLDTVVQCVFASTYYVELSNTSRAGITKHTAQKQHPCGLLRTLTVCTQYTTTCETSTKLPSTKPGGILSQSAMVCQTVESCLLRRNKHIQDSRCVKQQHMPDVATWPSARQSAHLQDCSCLDEMHRRWVLLVCKKSNQARKMIWHSHKGSGFNILKC
jgi:hypothetical protein